MRLSEARDNLLGRMADLNSGTDDLRALANQFRAAQRTRASDPDYVKCPRCWDWHLVRLNFGHTAEEEAANPELAREKLCDECQQFIVSDHPSHPSVPHIRAALAAQRERFTAPTV